MAVYRAGQKEHLTDGKLATRYNLRLGFLLKIIYCKECWIQCAVWLSSNTTHPRESSKTPPTQASTLVAKTWLPTRCLQPVQRPLWGTGEEGLPHPGCDTRLPSGVTDPCHNPQDTE